VEALQSKQLTLGAPVKADLSGDAKTQAELYESIFSDWDVENGASAPGVISPVYLRSVAKLGLKVKNYWDDMLLDSDFYYQHRNISQVIQITVGWNGDMGWPTVVSQRTRPCAVDQGFYELVLWAFKNIIVRNEAYGGLIIEDVAANEEKFYTDKGFVKADKDKLGKRNPITNSEFDNPYWITRDEILKANKKAWNVKTVGQFPSASDLMTQAWVDTTH
jgi:hypothetical protein